MTGEHRRTTAARVASVVLLSLAVIAGTNTAYVVAYALREPSAGAVAAATAGMAVTAALGVGARRIWRASA